MQSLFPKLVFGLVFLLFGALPATASVPAPEQQARELVEWLGTQAIETLQEDDDPRNVRSRFSELLTEGFNTQYIGRFVLGPFWRQATPEQRDEYLTLFEQMIVEIYAGQLRQYSGQTFELTSAQVISERGERSDVAVQMEIQNPGGQVLPVDWRVRVRPEGARIIDVAVAGVSLSRTQREEFTAVIQRNGGNVQALIDQLRSRIANGGAQ